MSQRFIKTGVELDRETDVDLDEWAKSEERSKRRHAAILLRKLVCLKKTHFAELARLGLVDPVPSN